MNKEQARKLYELADRLGKLDVNTLSEQQLVERSTMISRLQEEVKSMSRAAKGHEKYGKAGMQALAKAGREGASEEKMDDIRDKHNKYDESVQDVAETELDEKWSQKYKSSINCSDPKGFSQKAHCASKNESIQEANGEYDNEGTVYKNALQVLKNEVELPLSEYIPKNVLRRSLNPIQNLLQSGINNLPIPVNYESIQEANGEYDDEAGMAKSNLLTMNRAVQGLLKTIEDNDNLPEWAQEKIAKAEMMLVSVWDYLQSQKEQGIDPKVEESKKPSPKLTAVNIKKSDTVSEEINTEAYERLQKVFAFKNYES